MQRDDFSAPVDSSDDWKLNYLKKFLQFMENWKTLQSRFGLTDPTFNAFVRTTDAIIMLSRHLLTTRRWNFVLTGSFVSDPIEKR